MKNFLVKTLLLLLAVCALTGCQSTRPASVAGECALFQNPGFAVQGKSRNDQRAIDSRWIEPGVASCGWQRPKN